MYMTIRSLSRASALLIVPALLLAAAPFSAEAADIQSLSVGKITFVPVSPTCEVRSTKKRMTSGSTTEIVWESKNATKMTGLVKGDATWPTKGRERVSIAVLGKHEFPMTFEGPGGKTTCVAKVFVKERKIQRR